MKALTRRAYWCTLGLLLTAATFLGGMLTGYFVITSRSYR